MLLIRLVELILIVLFIWSISTQIITPAIFGKKLFPIFNKRRNALLKEKATYLQDIEDNMLEKEVDLLYKEASTTPINQNEGSEK